ncbi:MAG: adenylate/guanylate cyclase domain-containing protein [Hyphomicrobiaceae bacterium]|nr:adenylate/guanylate cyclase domain-containing protein [Hyphomicrobiaceae bacterium]
MTRRRFHPGSVVGIGLAALALLLGLFALDPAGSRGLIRERVDDWLLSVLVPPPASPNVLVVDIDRATLAELGPWPWGRDRLAGLVERIAAAGPSVVGFDILLDEPDRLSAAALARALASAAPGASLAAGGPLADGDPLLAAAARLRPTVFGFVLDPETSRPPLPLAPILTRGTAELPGIWRGVGFIGPNRTLAAAASGMGALPLSVDPDGRVRRVPLLVRTAQAVAPGLAVELLRLAAEASGLILEAAPARLTVGEQTLALDADAKLRLVPRDPSHWAARTISARQLADPRQAARLRGHLVLLGGSAPELGGLRVAASTSAAPSVQLHADAAEQILAGAVFTRPPWLGAIELAALAAMGLAMVLVAARLKPRSAIAASLVILAVWIAAAVLVTWRWRILADPVGPPILAGLVFTLTALAGLVRTELRERALRRRFEQHLAPDVVARLIAEPDLLRLDGEEREVTALFTDIEGFTAMTDRADPRAVVAALDGYFAAVSDVVIAHGGMIDKFVGDAVHALFGAPLDLAGHPERALDCAVAIAAATDAYRRRADIAALGFGRTRIGIETGRAIVGDVGGGRKLDYTAHGTAINTAARLEAANKDLGTAILVGPDAAAQIPPARLRPVGRLDLRGRAEPVEVFTPAVPTA